MAIDIGRINYQAYFDFFEGKTYNGLDMPKWETLTKKIQDAWRISAVAVLKYIDAEQEALKDDIDGLG